MTLYTCALQARVTCQFLLHAAAPGNDAKKRFGLSLYIVSSQDHGRRVEGRSCTLRHTARATKGACANWFGPHLFAKRNVGMIMLAPVLLQCNNTGASISNSIHIIGIHIILYVFRVMCEELAPNYIQRQS